MPYLSSGNLVCWEKAGAAGNNTFPNLNLTASSAARCWTRTVRRLTVNSMLNFMLSTKRTSNLQDKLCEYHVLTRLLYESTKSIFLFVNSCMFLWHQDLTLSWSRVWRCQAAHCERSHGTSPFFHLQDRPAAHPLVAQTDGSQTHQVPGRLHF